MQSSSSIQKIVRNKATWFLAGFLGLAIPSFAFGFAAQAETIRIVAIGASNTSGYAVGAANAYPARLEAVLKAKGYDVRVVNNGVTGDTSAGVLSRVDSAVTPGTQIVIYEGGAGNDADAGNASQTAANLALIEQRIRARGAKPIRVSWGKIVGTEKGNPSAWIAGPHHHMTSQSQARVAAALLPQVVAAIGKKK
jgi:acyl-CoA thioesterase-1